MQEFRRLVKGPIGKVLLAAIVIAFTASGFYGYFTGDGRGDAVAEVNGTSIYRQALQSQVQRYRAAMREQRPELDPKILEQFISPSMVLQGMINNALLLDYAQDADMAVSDKQAAAQIRQSEYFQGPDGRFSREAFERAVRGAGMNPSNYMKNLRQDMLRNQVRSAYQDTAFALPRELAEQRRLGEQTRDIRYLRMNLDSIARNYQVKDSEIQAYYEDNADEFTRPPRFRLAYVELNPERYADEVQITEEAIQREYEARLEMQRSASASGQRREAAHIMLKVGDERSEEEAVSRARELRQRLEAGASFAELAEQVSEDPATASQGGSLGHIRRGDLPKSLEKVLFALEPGEVSEPVVSDAGVHLIRLSGIEGEDKEPPSLEEMRGDIVRDLRQGQVDTLMAEDLARLDELAFEHSDLQTPAEQLNLDIRTTDWFSLENPQGIATHQAVREAMNSPEVRQDGHNSELLQLGGNRHVVVRIADRQPEEPRPLEEVADRIRERIKRDKARAELDSRAASIESAIEQGRDLDAIAGELDMEIESAESLNRGAGSPDRQLVSEAFAMPRPGDGVSGPRLVRLSDGGLAVLELTGVTDGDPGGLNPVQQAQALAQLGDREGQQELRRLMGWLRAEGDVDINQRVLEADGEDSQSGGARQAPQQPQGPMIP